MKLRSTEMHCHVNFAVNFFLIVQSGTSRIMGSHSEYQLE